ncbi:MAG: tRNA (adenosine(37)-N6)-threonylcarbamoyltransferase complex ATPase subunit type 1 TsaE [Clostridiales bacterium]|nr:tRNA (adenosine(37)-N6)-threonylcarbamoyltransferase complex ATPase subunit type 1 TsaE [Clostridiales bacterium]
MKLKKYAFCTKSEKETFHFGVQLAKNQYKTICLVGDLGSGKTVLSKGYASGVGILEQVTSPTFTIINQYEKNEFTFYHMDAYRITNEEMLYDLGFEELFDKNTCVVIEWADNIKNAIPSDALWITITKDIEDKTIRYFIIKGNEKQIEKLGESRLC